MADTKISDLSPASALTGAELVEMVQGGANVRSTAAAIAALAGGGGSSTLDPTRIDLQAALIPKYNEASVLGSAGYTPEGAVSYVNGSVTQPAYMNLSTAASVDSSSSTVLKPVLVSSGNSPLFSGLIFRATAVYPDASYSNARGGVGFSAPGLLPFLRSNDNGAGKGIAFQHSTTRGSVNWFLVSRHGSGGNFVAIDTGVPFSSGYWEFRIVVENGSSVKWSIQKRGSTGASGTYSANIPDIAAVGQSYDCGIVFRTLDAVARNYGTTGIYSYSLTKEWP